MNLSIIVVTNKKLALWPIPIGKDICFISSQNLWQNLVRRLGNPVACRNPVGPGLHMVLLCFGSSLVVIMLRDLQMAWGIVKHIK